MESRGAGFAGWNAADRSMLISTRFGNVSQLHRVAGADDGTAARSASRPSRSAAACRRPATSCSSARTMAATNSSSSTRSRNGRLTLLTAGGKSRNSLGAVEPRRQARRLQLDRAQRHRQRPLRHGPAQSRARSAASPRSRAAAGASPLSRPATARAIVAEYRSVTDVKLYRLDLASGTDDPDRRSFEDDRLRRRANSPPTARCGSPRTRAATSSASAASTPPPAASPRSAPPGTLGRRQLRHLQGRPHHRLRHQRSRDRPLVAARRRQRPHPPRRRDPRRDHRRARVRAVGRRSACR